MYTLVHLGLLVGTVLVICRETPGYLRRRFAPDHVAPVSRPPKLARLGAACGVALLVASGALVANMSCVFGCVPGPYGRVIDWVTSLLTVLPVYYLIRCAGAVFWHLKRWLVRRQGASAPSP